MAATKTESNVLRWNKDEKIRFPRIPPHTAGRKDPPSWDVIKQLSGSSPGVHTRIFMSAAGLHYTGEGDKAKCNDCELEVSNWTKAMYPFTIHASRSPNCPFVLKMKAPPSSIQSSANSTLRAAATTSEPENPSKRQKTETAKSAEPISITLYETNLLQQVRRRTFSHWPHRTVPSSAQMLEAGFFNCNVGDRVICLYCNLICQQWTPHTDDPCEVHKTLSPNCIYVKAKLIRPPASSIVIVNEPTTSATASGNQSPSSINLDPLRSHEIVSTAACNPAYTELPKRHASFASWAPEDLPSVDDLVRAGFFYTGSKTIVTCFYCNGSLQNWGPNDNPMIEHARWFPHCPYAKQLCGDDLYRKIQESKRAQQERARANEVKENNANGTASGVPNSNSSSSNQKLLIPDESTLSRLVAARLDLPISQRLLSLNFKLSIIKRCWEDQLRLKHDDFMSECDLFVACTILQKQIEHIDGKKENIAIPSVRMKQIREQNELRRQNPTSDSVSTSTMHTTDVDMTNSQSSTTESSSSMESNAKTSLPRDPTTQTNNATAPNPPANASEAKANPSTHSINDPSANNASSNNTCVLCWSEEKRLACMPCGHLATCVPCGHSLRSCPICRREIEAFVRIYI